MQKVKDLPEGFYKEVALLFSEGRVVFVVNNVNVAKRGQQKYLYDNRGSRKFKCCSYGEGTIIADISLASPLKR